MKTRNHKIERVISSRIRLESYFERQLKLAFQRISGSELRVEKKRGFLLFAFYPKPKDRYEFNRNFENLLLNPPSILRGESFIKKQLFEHLKNVFVHGGDAVIGIRRYRAFKRGKLQTVLEVVAWDNGEGIKGLKQAVEYSWSSTGLIMDDFSGFGRGLDYADGKIFSSTDPGKRIPFYVADEFKLESGNNIAYRRSRVGSHQFRVGSDNIRGTRVRSRFWLPV